MFVVDGECCRPILALHLGDDEFAIIGTQDGSRLADTGGANVLLHRRAGIGHLNFGQLLSCKEHHFLAILIDELSAEFLVLLHVDGAIPMCTGQHAFVRKSLVNLVVEAFIVHRMMGKAETDGPHHRHEMEFEHAVWRISNEGRDDDEQFVFLRVSLGNVVDDSHVVGLRLFQIVRTLVACLQEQGCWLAIDEGKDAVVHIVDVAGYGPVESLFEGVECPQSGIVALGGDDGIGTNQRSHFMSKFVGATHMS